MPRPVRRLIGSSWALTGASRVRSRPSVLVVLKVHRDCWQTGNPRIKVLPEDESASAALYSSQLAQFNRFIQRSTANARDRARFVHR